MADPAPIVEPANQPTPVTPIEPSNNAPAPVEPNPAPPAPAPTLQPGNEPEPAAPDAGDLQRLREQLAGGDEGILKGLERYRSVEAISKAFKEARNAAKTAGKPVTLTDKATPEEVKAFREAYGILDDAAAYPGDFRADFKASEADAAILGEFKAAMHSRNVPPAAAAAALDWYQDFATAQKQERDSTLVRVAKETQGALRSEWGGDYDGNLGAAKEVMTQHLGEEGFDRMMNLRLEDGSRLQDDLEFVKMMTQFGTDYYGSNAIFNGDIETTAKTLEEKIAETRKVQTEDRDKYYSAPYQEYVSGLYDQKEKLEARIKR